MVPLGACAFSPGYIQHCNELTVLLGDNYFVERSVKQTREILKRRQNFVDKEVAAAEDILHKLQGSLAGQL